MASLRAPGVFGLFADKLCLRRPLKLIMACDFKENVVPRRLVHLTRLRQGAGAQSQLGRRCYLVYIFWCFTCSVHVMPWTARELNCVCQHPLASSAGKRLSTPGAHTQDESPYSQMDHAHDPVNKADIAWLLSQTNNCTSTTELTSNPHYFRYCSDIMQLKGL